VTGDGDFWAIFGVGMVGLELKFQRMR
jgi:hypothetical protein